MQSWKKVAFSRLPWENCMRGSDVTPNYLNYIENNSNIPIDSKILATETEDDEVKNVLLYFKRLAKECYKMVELYWDTK